MPKCHGSKYFIIRLWSSGDLKYVGRMGRDTVTVQNVVLVKTLADRNIMMIKGAVPGRKGGLLKIRPAVKGQDK